MRIRAVFSRALSFEPCLILFCFFLLEGFSTSTYSYQTMPKKGKFSLEGLDLHYAESHIQGRREYMEDRVVCKKLKLRKHETGAFFGVFDGHNGDAASIFLASEFPQKLKSRLSQQLDETPVLVSQDHLHRVPSDQPVTPRSKKKFAGSPILGLLTPRTPPGTKKKTLTLPPGTPPPPSPLSTNENGMDNSEDPDDLTIDPISPSPFSSTSSFSSSSPFSSSSSSGSSSSSSSLLLSPDPSPSFTACRANSTSVSASSLSSSSSSSSASASSSPFSFFRSRRSPPARRSPPSRSPTSFFSTSKIRSSPSTNLYLPKPAISFPPPPPKPYPYPYCFPLPQSSSSPPSSPPVCHLRSFFTKSQKFEQRHLQTSKILVDVCLDLDYSFLKSGGGAAGGVELGLGGGGNRGGLAGSTGVVVVLVGGVLYVSNTGDSRCILCRSKELVDGLPGDESCSDTPPSSPSPLLAPSFIPLASLSLPSSSSSPSPSRSPVPSRSPPFSPSTPPHESLDFSPSPFPPASPPSSAFSSSAPPLCPPSPSSELATPSPSPPSPENVPLSDSPLTSTTSTSSSPPTFVLPSAKKPPSKYEIMIKPYKVAVHQLTVDHKTSHPRERRRLKKKGVPVSGGRVRNQLAMSRAFGDSHLKDKNCRAGDVTCEPDISLVNPASHDQFLVIASDGLWDVMKNEEVTVFILRRIENQKGEWEEGKGKFIPNLSEIVKELTTYAHDVKKTQDNTSVIIVYFEFKDGQ